jgi:hypothetical protein
MVALACLDADIPDDRIPGVELSGQVALGFRKQGPHLRRRIEIWRSGAGEQHGAKDECDREAQHASSARRNMPPMTRIGGRQLRASGRRPPKSTFDPAAQRFE